VEPARGWVISRHPAHPALVSEADFILHVGYGQAQGGGAVQVTGPAEAAGLIDRLRTSGVTLTYDPDTRTLRTGDNDAVAVTVGPDR